MNIIKMENKNLIDKYQPTPNMYYDVEGRVKDVNGKTIKIEKQAKDQVIEYTIRLKEEMEVRVGDRVKVEKDNIRSMEMDKKEDKIYSEEETRDIEKILRDLGLEYSQENIQMIDKLISIGIKPTKNNIESYKKSKEILGGIIEEIDTESVIKMLDSGVDLEEASLQEVAEALEAVKNGEEGFSIKKFLNIDRDLSYKEAEEISKEIYGQKMGKDVYDIIIALDKENLPISRENIERAIDVIAKVNDLKGLEDKPFVDILNNDLDFSINNLFKLKNDYTVNNIVGNSLAGRFEDFTVSEEVSLDSLKQVLLQVGLEDTSENISIAREFVLLDMDVDREDYARVINMKEKVEELKQSLTNESLLKLLDRNVDIGEEDIGDLVDVLNMADEFEGLASLEIGKMENLEVLNTIEDRDLLRLIREGRDFNLKNIKEIKNSDIKNDLSLDFKVVDRSKQISHMFSIIGDRPDRKTMALASSRSEEISLNNLYDSQIELNNKNIKLDNISKERENIILNEYMRARNDISTNIIRESIIDGSEIELMPLTELNHYMDRKINRYREVSQLTSDLKTIKNKEDRILALIMKNDLDMTLKEIKDINSYLKGEEGITRNIREKLRETNKKYSREYKEELRGLQKDISESVKEAGESFKEDYKDLINLLSSGKSNLDSRDEDKGENKFIEVQKKLSKKDMVFQVPLEIDGEFKDLNIIIPDMGREIDKNNMSFSVSLITDNLGPITMDLRLVGRDLSINIEEESDKLSSKIGHLKNAIESIGYNLDLIRNR